jgi:hypothetical protein
MLDVSSWFVIKSKKERERDKKKYFNRVFPLGEAQKEKDGELLEQLIPASEIQAQEKLFLLISMRDLYTDPTREEDDGPVNEAVVMKGWHGWKVAKHISDQEKALFLALARLSLKAPSLEEYPQIADIRALADEILAKVQADKPE